VSALPTAFELGNQRDRREAILVHQLLLQVPDVHKLTVDRIYAAGLSTISGLAGAAPSELHQVAGIPRERAAAVVAHFQTYLAERRRTSPEQAREATYRKLDAALAALEQAQEAFLQAESDEDAARKRKARRDKRARC